MTLAEMRAARQEAIAAMRALIDAAAADSRTSLNEAEAATYAEHEATVTALATDIARLETLEGLEAHSRETRPAASRGQSGGAAPAGGRTTAAPGPEAVREFENFGEFMASVRFNPNDSRLSSLFSENVGAGTNIDPASAEMRMSEGASGGFMVPEQFRTTIMMIEGSPAIVRPRATVIPAGSPPDSSITIPVLDQSTDGNEGDDNFNGAHVFGGVTVQWIAEGDEKPESDTPEIAQIKLEPHEIAGHITVTDKLLRNWGAAGPFLEGRLRDAVWQTEDYAAFRGDGIGKPLGIDNSGVTLRVNRAQAGTITYRDLVAMEGRILMRAGMDPVWVISQSVLGAIRLLKDDEGKFIFVENARDGMGRTLLGYPVIINNRRPILGKPGDIGLYVFGAYLIKDGSGPFVAASEHVKFTQNKTVIKIFWNVDGQPWMKEPFKEENLYEVSPFVQLDVPA
jgi:HK97 family phage major capsid protein